MSEITKEQKTYALKELIITAKEEAPYMLEEGTTGRDVLDIADIWLKELEVKEKESDTIDFLSGFFLLFLIFLFVATLTSIPFRNKELTEFWLICDFCVGASLSFVRLLSLIKNKTKK